MKTGSLPKSEYPPSVLPASTIPKILKGQKALVTGANSGIGRAIALALGQAGADVAVNYIRKKDEAEEVVQSILTHGVRAITIQADVSKEDQVRGMFQAVIRKFDGLDILVNNAGIQRDSPFDELSLEAWQEVISVNLTGQFLCAREAVKEFKKKGVRKEISCAAGKIIAISSVHEVIPWAGHVNYCASKGGVMMMTKSIAQEVAPYRIRVNSIAPGAIRTRINQQAWSDPKAVEDLLNLIPYKRIGEVEDVARVAIWLASDLADYITGETIFVDGGMTLYPGFETGG